MNCRLCDTVLKKNKVMCHSCGAITTGAAKHKQLDGSNPDGTILLRDVRKSETPRILCGIPSQFGTGWDVNFGNKMAKDGKTIIPLGVATTSVNLMGGVPGAGKSTMMQQILDQISETTKRETLYVGKEEDAEQVKDRGYRLGLKNMGLMRILPVDKQEGGIDLRALFETYKPAACCVDSVTAYAEGQAEQVTICKMLKEFAVKYRCPCFAIGHVTKEEEFGGEMGLQHAVDGTHMLYNEQCKVPVIYNGVVYTEVRVLRTEKNRNGMSGAKVDTFYVMTEKGLVQVYDPELAEEEDDDDRGDDGVSSGDDGGDDGDDGGGDGEIGIGVMGGGGGGGGDE